MEVRATAKGFHGCFREIGDQFEVPAGSKASWYVPAEDKVAEKPAKRSGDTKQSGSTGDDAAII